MRFSVLAGLLTFGAGIFWGSVRADNPPGTNPTGGEASRSVYDSKPESIFNEKLRCFKFELPYTDLVTLEEAISFQHRYKRKGNPEIIGAFPDPKTNSLCVIGPPEAEQAIRQSLAISIIELQGISGYQPGVSTRGLEHERKELLGEMAGIEMALVEAELRKEAKAVDDLKDRMASFEEELKIIEAKIQVAKKYAKRIEQTPT